MANPMISLRIAGTKQRQAGFAPLATVGVLAGNEGDNMDRVTMVAEKPAYIVKHAADYILYGLIDRQVKSFDADAPGVLSIALTIPSNMQLANNVSPFRLIQDIYETFLFTYMERLSDGRDSFVNVDCDSDLFRKMLNQYSLEERKSVYIKMNPQGMTGIVCVSPNDLEDFFRNTQYKEFASFKDIEVGVSCQRQVSMGLERLQIPLPQNVFDVWVNGKSTGSTMQSPTDSFYASDQNSSTYSYESVEFTLAELINTPLNRITKNGAKISIDFLKNRIYCDLQKIDVFYDFVYEWTDNVGDAQNKIESFVKSKNIRIYFGEEDVSPTLFGRGKIKASDIKGRTLEIKPKTVGSYSLNAHSDIDELKHQIITRIIINKRAIEAPQNTERSSQQNRVLVATSVNNSIGSDDYFKGGEKQTEATTNAQKKKVVFDIKSFAVGVFVGLILGIGIWFVYSLFSNDSSKGNKNSDSQQMEQIADLGGGGQQVTQEDPDSDQANKSSKAEEEMGPIITELGDGNLQKDYSNVKKIDESESIANINEAKATIATMIKNGERDLDKIKKTDAFKQLKKPDQYLVSRIVDPKNGLGPEYKDIFKKSDLSSIKTMVNNTPISGWADIVTLSENIEDKLKDIVLSKGGTIK